MKGSDDLLVSHRGTCGLTFVSTVSHDRQEITFK